MLKICLLIGILSFCTASNPGYIFSRGIDDMQSYIQLLVPSIVSGVVFSDNFPLDNISAKDHFSAVEVNVTDITVKNIIITPANVKVAISSPN